MYVDGVIIESIKKQTKKKQTNKNKGAIQRLCADCSKQVFTCNKTRFPHMKVDISSQMFYVLLFLMHV